MKTSMRIPALMLSCGLAGCATFPNGPSIMALPGTGSNFEQFRADDSNCQMYAQQMVGQREPNETAADSAAKSAAVGTIVGAAAGAMIGAASGDAGEGAAIGGGTGLILGAAAGSDAYSTTGYLQQDRYDSAYVQCMYARGHLVPVPASAASAYQQQPAPVPTPGSAPVNPSLGGSYPPPGTSAPPGYRK